VTGPEHFREAQMELAPDGGCEYGCPHAACAHEMARIARAQVHATLALAAATALSGFDMPTYDYEAWYAAGATPRPAESSPDQ